VDAGGTGLDMSLQSWSRVGAGHFKEDFRIPTSVEPRVPDGRVNVGRPKQFLLSLTVGPVQFVEPRMNDCR
jgi:hypothetical protein